MTAASAETRPQRRVGTFTLGIVLVAAGGVMLASLLRPGLDIGWILKASPVILVVLGVEVLLAAWGGGRVKYDLLGMLLCFILVGAGLVMYAAAWFYSTGEYFNASDCSRWADDGIYHMEYGYFDGFDSHTFELKAGDVLEGQVDTCDGWLEVEISDGDGDTVCEGSPINGEQRVEISRSGSYTILVHGRRASGSFSFSVVPAETAGGAEDALPEDAGDAQ